MKRFNLIAETQRRREAESMISMPFYSSPFLPFFVAMCLCVLAVNIFTQETPPAPSASKAVTVPAVSEKKLANGLTIAVVEKKAVPLVTIQLLVKSGASSEDASKAGLADLTASLLTKGTKTRTATQIAEAVEFLGGTLNSGADWNGSFVRITVTSDKVDQAMAILADVVLNPKFDDRELELLKSQTLDGLTYNLKQPSFLANYVASKYSFNEHPAGGTPASIRSITQADIANFYEKNYRSDMSVLIFAGDFTSLNAATVGEKYLGSTKKWEGPATVRAEMLGSSSTGNSTARRILVIDLPNSGQAAVSYYKLLEGIGRKSESFYPATVMNTVLGGGYSARLNYEIRIKRGLSYGAGSSVTWRWNGANFATRAQTKNQSASEVAELTLAEVKRLTETPVTNDEMIPRKSVLTGNFGRNLETTGGLVSALSELYAFRIPTRELNSYVSHVNGISDAQIKVFATNSLLGGDIIIVGDYSVFKEDLARRFSNMDIKVIKADELDLSKDNLRK